MLKDTSNNPPHKLKETELNVKSNLLFFYCVIRCFFTIRTSVELRKVSPAFVKYLLMMICEPS